MCRLDDKKLRFSANIQDLPQQKQELFCPVFRAICSKKLQLFASSKPSSEEKKQFSNCLPDFA